MGIASDTQFHVGWTRVSLVRHIAFGSLALGSVAFLLSAVFPFSVNITGFYLHHEDRWLLLVQSGLLLALGAWLRRHGQTLLLPKRALPFIALGVIGIDYLGTKWLLFGYELSRDEQMAVFDSRIFGSGHLTQTLAPFWQAHAGALNTLFMLPVLHPIAWVSAYLPMNAALRVLVGLVADPALTGPFMVALGLISLWKCARLLWPDDGEAAVVAVLLYLGSGQVVFAGMTAYAMPAHLALNLLWLWCFLLNRRINDAAALLVAFVATGLHQPLFHPLFAAPILFTLVRERNWPRIAMFATGYALISAFWLAWPTWMHALVTGPGSLTAAAGTDYFTRLSRTLSQRDPTQWRDMAANLLRFFAWQHMLLLPLVAAGVALARRERMAAAFAASAIMPVYVMFLLLPFQAAGFGYRYLHGEIGAAILLAVYGWKSIVLEREWLRPLMVRTTIAAIIVVLPLQAWMAHNLYAPFARIDRRITESGADYFLIGGTDAPLSFDLVVNRPDLSNRPIRLLGEEVDGSLIRAICRQGARMAMPTSAALRPIETYFGLPHSTKADERITTLSPRLEAAGCRVERLDGQ